jgi:hypothetical protein
MAFALLRKIYRGWTRHESYWDTPGMDENLRYIGDVLPLNVVASSGPIPTSGDEGDCWIEPSTGNFAVWSTGIKLQTPSWNIYAPIAGFVGFESATDTLWVNNGESWQDYAAIFKLKDVFDD